MNVLVINIDSRFRDKTIFSNPNYFQLHLPTPVKDVVSLRISSVEYPNVEKLIQPWRQNDSFAINDYWLSIPEGSYSAAQLVKEVNSLVSYLNIIVTANDFTGQTTIESKNDIPFNLQFSKGDLGYPSLGEIMGFTYSSYTGSASYTSESTINIAADSYIFLRLNDFGVLTSPTVDMRPVMAKVILTTGVFTMVMDNGSNLVTKQHDCDQPITIYGFTIELLDYLGHRLHSNSNYSFTVELSYIRNSSLKLLRSQGLLDNLDLPDIGSILLENESDDGINYEESFFPTTL